MIDSKFSLSSVSCVSFDSRGFRTIIGFIIGHHQSEESDTRKLITIRVVEGLKENLSHMKCDFLQLPLVSVKESRARVSLDPLSFPRSIP